MRIRRGVAIVSAVLACVRSGVAFDYEVTSNYPGGAYVWATQNNEYVQGRPRSADTGIEFVFHSNTPTVFIYSRAGLPIGAPASSLRMTGYFSGGGSETISANEGDYDNMGGWYYYHMSGWFRAPVGQTVSSVRMISSNSDTGADVRGTFYLDSDGDGLLDVDETAVYHTDPNLRDTDEDGLTDGEEVNTATDPTNSASFFRISSMTNCGSTVDFALSWPATNAKQYRVDATYDVLNASWAVESNGIAGATSSVSMVVHTSAGQTAGLYRVYQSTDSVTGRNAVGFARIHVRSNTLFLARNDFDSLTTASMAISNVIGDQLPAGAQILLWDKAAQAWRTPITKSVFGWGTAGSNMLSRGDAFFIRLLASAPSNVYPVCFVGEAPDRVGDTGTVLSVVSGLTLIGDPYPVSRFWTSTVISAVLPIGAQLLLWNETNQAYDVSITKSVFGWGSAGNAVQLHPGIGFWVRATNSFSFSESKPYSWP